MGKNRLANESSLYLKQHADNPVDWWPWCDEAFEVAEREGKPVLVSIGYSSCHWCHVMAHECFEDDYIASLMNRHFVNIKVDREERPDVDQIYMEAIQMMNQPGGWPLNVFCLPDKTPFTGGTYFPPEDRGHGLIPWPHLLLRIQDAYQNEHADLQKNGNAIRENLNFLSGSVLEEDRQWDDQILLDGARSIVETLDPRFGGFGGAPKFPPAQVMGYLMAVRHMSPCEKDDSELTESIDEAVRLCSHALVRGGLFDHVGGGFFRYSVDAEWKVPHFEKMLYDNALILEALSKAWTRTRWDGLMTPVKKTVYWLLNEFQVETGVFASAIDADSDEGEGAYYLWSEAELRNSISSVEVESFLESFSIRGNDPLNLYPWSIEDNAYLAFAPVLNDLKELREFRSQPTLDRKILLSWNGLLLRGLTVAGYVFGEKEWLSTVQVGLDWIWQHMRRDDGSLSSVYYPGKGAIESGDGFLDDYVNFALANLQFACVADWVKPGLSKCYWDRAIELTTILLDRFGDSSNEGEGFFFCSENDAKELIVRKKEWFDNANPSGNSGVVHLLSQLNTLDENSSYQKALSKLQEAYVERSRRMPNGIAFGMEGLTWNTVGIVSIKVGIEVNVDALMDQLRLKAWRPFCLKVDSQINASQLQMCVGQQCFAPTESIQSVVDRF